MAYLADKILKGFDEGFLTGMILIDFQKAIDTINHEVLLQKRKAIRFPEQSIQWFSPTFVTEYLWWKLKTNYLILEIFLVEFLRVPFWDLFYF